MKIAPTEAEVLLEALGDTDCQLDHNGDCQEHGWFGINGKCPVAISKELIATALKAPGPDAAEIDALLQEWKPTRPVFTTKAEDDNYRRQLRNALLEMINGGKS